MLRNLAPLGFLGLLLALVASVYWPGLSGDFLFDDYPNLSDLGVQGEVSSWEALRFYVMSGWSGPTGRPLSLLSFLLDDNTWPSVAWGFKLTNLKLHLITGLLLCWVCILLLRARGLSEREAVWAALLCASIWLLHPFMVSTTLYVVQRMALLSTLFILAATAIYLYGRQLLSAPETLRRGYFIMAGAVGGGTLLSLLSKENGALLPLLLLVVEHSALRRSVVRPSKSWMLLFLGIPSLAVVGYLLSLVDFSANPWPTRNFNQVERLLTEARVIWDYLFRLFIPAIEGRGLFQDGFEVSRGVLQPWTTLPAILGVLGLLFFGCYAARQGKLLGLAILYFFAAHLIESTVVGLELYFEHRNYLASVFLFLPLSLCLVRLFDRMGGVSLICSGLILVVLAYMTWMRASLWGDGERLELHWAVASPQSARAQNTIATYLLNAGRYDEAIAHIAEASERLPQSSLLSIRLLLMKVEADRAVADDFSRTGELLARQPFDAQTVSGLRLLVERLVANPAQRKYAVHALHLVDMVEANSPYTEFPLFRRIIPYLKAQLYLAQGDWTRSCNYYRAAMKLYADPEASMMMVAEVAEAGGFSCARELLQAAEENLQGLSDRSLKRDREFYKSEIKRLDEILSISAGAE